MKIIFKTTALTLGTTLGFFGAVSFGEPGAAMPLFGNQSFAPTRAPEFPAGLTWFNTAKPLSIKELRGKVVLLDFWTYGCINCIHVIPDLKKLEAKYGNQLVVIAVHSAKFDTENDPRGVRSAALRYGIEHPVVVDANHRIWDEYTVRAWPTQVLIDPGGKVVASLAGEGHFDEFDALIGKITADFKARGELNEKPLPLPLEQASVSRTPLYFPGKIAANAGRLVIADSSHNRLIVSNQNGQVEAVIGSGEAGLQDGDFTHAQFFNPQGVWPEGQQIYVADTNNHAIRCVDLVKRTVETLAGNGQQAAFMSRGGVGTSAALSSPWDVLKQGDNLFIAMAGPHQIWKLDLNTKEVGVWAGSGAEARTDGPRLSANFAQPSGLASDGQSLFVADAESSCIRAINFETGEVKTLAGGNLFDFGDQDGPGDEARFRHPLGLAYHDDTLFVSDSYNGKIRRLNPRTGAVTTAFGGQKLFNEPGGLAFAGNELLVADTNNHQILKASVDAISHKEPQFQSLKFAGLSVPKLTAPTAATPPKALPKSQTYTLAPNSHVMVVLDVQLPNGFHLNELAPQKLEVKATGAGLKVLTPSLTGKSFQLPLKVATATGQSGRGSLELQATVGYCNTGKNAICQLERIKRRIAFNVKAAPDAVQTIKLSAKLP